jgi:hypothetical protein
VSGSAQVVDGDVFCTVERSPGVTTTVSVEEEGELCFLRLRISVQSVRADVAPGATRPEGVPTYGS